MRATPLPDESSMPELDRQLAVIGATPRKTDRISALPVGPRRKPRRWRFGVGLAAAILLAIGLWPDGRQGRFGSNRVYGIAEVIARLRSARVLYLEGSVCLPSRLSPDQQQAKARAGGWLDLVNGRTHVFVPEVRTANGQSEAVIYERISDGECQMTIDHTHKTVRYEKLTPYDRMLDTRDSLNTLLKDMFGDAQHPGRFKKVGEETIDGQTLEAWEGTFPHRGGACTVRSKCWVDVASGNITRMQVWKKRVQASADSGEMPMLEHGTIERRETAPEGTFALTPPEGYVLLNQRATAPVREPLHLGGLIVGNLIYKGYFALVLDDDSVILGWISTDNQTTARLEDLFANKGLVWGGPLPSLPIVIYGLEEEIDGRKLTYAGRHLAYTRKGDQFVEWSIYVPEDPPLPGNTSLGRKYRALTRPLLRLDGKRPLDINISETIDVEKGEFDMLVRGAMAELSDGGAVPNNVTYSNVMALSRRIRESLRR